MEVFYEPRTRDASELSEFVDELLQEVYEGGSILKEASDAGVDVRTLLQVSGVERKITIQAGLSGFDPVSTVIIVTIARPIVLDLWRKLFLPKIMRRWGATAIGPEVKPPETLANE
jgi:hypothetical protein